MAIEARFDCPFWHQVVDFRRKSPDSIARQNSGAGRPLRQKVDPPRK
jgi:hypothetical protein